MANGIRKGDLREFNKGRSPWRFLSLTNTWRRPEDTSAETMKMKIIVRKSLMIKIWCTRVGFKYTPLCRNVALTSFQQTFSQVKSCGDRSVVTHAVLIGWKNAVVYLHMGSRMFKANFVVVSSCDRDRLRLRFLSLNRPIQERTTPPDEAMLKVGIWGTVGICKRLRSWHTYWEMCACMCVWVCDGMFRSLSQCI